MISLPFAGLILKVNLNLLNEQIVITILIFLFSYFLNYIFLFLFRISNGCETCSRQSY